MIGKMACMAIGWVLAGCAALNSKDAAMPQGAEDVYAQTVDNPEWPALTIEQQKTWKALRSARVTHLAAFGGRYPMLLEHLENQAQQHGVKLEVDWKNLDQWGILPNVLVTCDMRDVTLEEALQRLLSPKLLMHGLEGGFAVRPDGVVVATSADKARALEDVTLRHPAADFFAGREGDTAERTAQRREEVLGLVEIEAGIASHGEVKWSGSDLEVRHTPEGQRTVASVLRRLRAARGYEISFEIKVAKFPEGIHKLAGKKRYEGVEGVAAEDAGILLGEIEEMERGGKLMMAGVDARVGNGEFVTLRFPMPAKGKTQFAGKEVAKPGYRKWLGPAGAMDLEIMGSVGGDFRGVSCTVELTLPAEAPVREEMPKPQTTVAVWGHPLWNGGTLVLPLPQPRTTEKPDEPLYAEYLVLITPHVIAPRPTGR